MVHVTLPLYNGERLEIISGFPALYKFFPADSSKLLLVFVPGAAHNARIAYGCHDGAVPEDFLASALNSKGYPFLALSYPVESLLDEAVLMPATCPSYRICDWGRQAAVTTKQVINEHKLSGRVVLLGWSMGGKVIEPFTTVATELGITVELFIALSATPGIYGIRGKVPSIERTKAGYATYKGLIDRMVLSLHEQQDRASGPHRTIIPDDIYLRDYLGHTPIGLAAWGARYNHESPHLDAFIEDEWEMIADSRADNFGGLPFMTAIYGTAPSDIRHVIVDKVTWGFMLTYKLLADIERWKVEVGAVDIHDENWRRMIDLIHSAPAKLSHSVNGNHLFFVGEQGAKATADTIEMQITNAKEFEAKFTSLLGQLKRT
ncbi:thioesterase domain protein [Xylogone sp. PMI_703]|nr:thioesterase domain protein [Xylogone sp. PMI_703]